MTNKELKKEITTARDTWQNDCDEDHTNVEVWRRQIRSMVKNSALWTTLTPSQQKIAMTFVEEVEHD